MAAAPQARLAAAVLGCAMLSACATPGGGPVGFAALSGWGQEDHLAALRALAAACRSPHAPELEPSCGRLRRSAPNTAREARRFLEANFQPVRVPGSGLLTAYFTPVYSARLSPDETFSAPIRPRPADLQKLDPRATEGSSAYLTRAQIEQQPAPDALGWMRPEELFFMQLQGSAILNLPDGRRVKAVTAATNNQPFVGIARVLRERGLMADGDTSGAAIMAWLAAHRGATADEVMRQNPRYGFFELQPFDGSIAGAAGTPLPTGRAVAVDLSRHQLGDLLWIDASAPVLAGAFPAYRRTVAALDTGGAIKGDVRADLYLGVGEAAGREAGRVRHSLTMFRLAPRR